MVPFQVSRRTSFVEPRFSVTVESKRLSERSCDERKPAFFLLRGVHRETRKEITVRIAQIAPLAEAVPPKLYGGTERVVSWLTEELVAEGHEVTLFRERRFQDLGKAGSMRATRAEVGGHPRSYREPPRNAQQRPPARRSVRRDPFPHRSPAIPPIPGSRPQVRDDAARSAGSPRLSSGLSCLSQYAAGLDFERPAATHAWPCELARDRLPRPALVGLPVQPRGRRLPCLSGPDRPGEAPRPGN